MDRASPGSPTSETSGFKSDLFGVEIPYFWRSPLEIWNLEQSQTAHFPPQNSLEEPPPRETPGETQRPLPQDGGVGAGSSGGANFCRFPGSIALVSFSPPLRFPSQSLTRTSCSASPSPSSPRLSASGYTPAPSPRT